MKDKIPFDKLYDYIKYQLVRNLNPTHDEFVEYHRIMNEHFALMQQVEWEDFENLTKDEMARIPISWIYDWTHVCGGSQYQDKEKIENLYKKHNLEPFEISSYQTRKIFANTKTKEEYFYEIEKLLSKSFENKSVEEISNLPVEMLIKNTDESIKSDKEFRQRQQQVIDKITKKYYLSKNSKHSNTSDDKTKAKSQNPLQEKIDKILDSGRVGCAMLQRIFRIGYPKASSIVESLLKDRIIVDNIQSYKIVNPEKLKKFLLNKMV